MEIIQRVLEGKSITSIVAELCVNKGMINSWIKKTQNLNNLIFYSDQGWQYQMKQYY